MPLLFAGGVWSAVDVFGAVRALVVLPELPVAGGALGAGAASAVAGVGLVLLFDSGVRALVVLPVLAEADGSLAVEPAAVVLEASVAALDLRLRVELLLFSAAVSVLAAVPPFASAVSAFDLRLRVDLVLLPSAAVASPVAGVAVAELSALLFLDLLAEVPSAAVVLESDAFAPSALFFFFLDLVVEVSVDAD
jgi:hypothetical protein